MCNDTVVIISDLNLPLIIFFFLKANLKRDRFKNKQQKNKKTELVDSCSFALGALVTVKQQSSSTPSHSHSLFSFSPSLPLWACRHYLMSLSFSAAGVGVWWWCWWLTELLPPADGSDSASRRHRFCLKASTL